MLTGGQQEQEEEEGGAPRSQVWDAGTRSVITGIVAVSGPESPVI